MKRYFIKIWTSRICKICNISKNVETDYKPHHSMCRECDLVLRRQQRRNRLAGISNKVNIHDNGDGTKTCRCCKVVKSIDKFYRRYNRCNDCTVAYNRESKNKRMRICERCNISRPYRSFCYWDKNKDNICKLCLGIDVVKHVKEIKVRVKKEKRLLSVYKRSVNGVGSSFGSMRVCIGCNQLRPGFNFSNYVNKYCKSCESDTKDFIEDEEVFEEKYNPKYKNRVLRACIGMICRGNKFKYLLKGRFTCDGCLKLANIYG